MRFILLLLFTVSNPLQAYETDQYSSLFHELPDSTQKLDRVVNDVIKNAAFIYEGERDEAKFFELIKDALNARQLEKWVNDHTEIASWNIPLESVYKTTAWFDSPIIRFKGLADTFSLNGVHIGSDKMSHFFGVGGIYFNKVVVKKTDSLEEAIAYGDWTERAQWGELTTNVFSNADLVVNYEGYLFFKSLFEDDVIPGKKAIISWEGDRPVVNRAFTFRDHVNDFWSEALLPNWYQISIRGKVRGVLGRYCYDPRYIANPERFFSKEESQLFKRYKQLNLHLKAMAFRLDHICSELYQAPLDEQIEFLVKQTKIEVRYSYRNRPARTPIEEQITNLNDLEAVFDIVKSPFPGCKKHLKHAWLEHEAMENWLDENQAELSCEWTTLPIEFERKKMHSISLRHCEGETQYLVKAQFKTFWSDSNFYSVRDRLGYVYRNIPYLCKWY